MSACYIFYLKKTVGKFVDFAGHKFSGTSSNWISLDLSGMAHLHILFLFSYSIDVTLQIYFIMTN